MKSIYWTTRNGQKINVDDMTIHHLWNTLNMILRTMNPRVKQWYDSHLVDFWSGKMLLSDMRQALKRYILVVDEINHQSTLKAITELNGDIAQSETEFYDEDEDDYIDGEDFHLINNF